MTNLLVLLNVVSIVASNQSIQFSELLSHAGTSDISFATENNITDWNDYEAYLQDQIELNCNTLEKDKDEGNDGSISDSILDVRNYLNENYSDYYWIRDTDECALTSDVSNHIPIEMQSNYFPEADIDRAIIAAGVENETSYMRSYCCIRNHGLFCSLSWVR